MPFTDYGPGDEITWGRCTDPRDPRWIESDETPLADWEADEIAEEEFASTAFEVADFLIDAVQLVDEAKQPVDTMRIHERDIQDAPIHVLLALIMTGTDQQANFARMFLRDHFKRTKAYWIGERAAELLREANGPEEDPSSIGCEFDD